MADNVSIHAGATSALDVIAAEDIAGAKLLRLKIALGTNGVDGGNLSATNPLPVSGTVTASGPLTDTQLRATAVPISGTVTASGPLTDSELRATAVPVAGAGELTPASGQVSGSGNNTLITPASGKRVRVYYAAYNPLLAVEAAFRFAAAGALWLRNNVTANSVIAKDFGDFRYVQGAVDEVLILNLSLAVSTNWSCFYVEA